MSSVVGEAVVTLRADGKQVPADASRAGKAAGGSYSSSFLGEAKKIAVGLGAFMVARGAVRFLTDSVEKASDLQETVSKTGVVFGAAADDILRFSSRGATALGQTRQQALDAASTFGIVGKAAGLQGPALADFSTSLVGLSTDMASFHNADPEEVILALGAALRGESEPIRRFGVLLDDMTLRQEAVRQGLIATTKEGLTPQQKSLAAYSVIMRQTKDAQGDFQRTSDGLANQQRILSASIDDTKTKIGAVLLPVVTDFVQYVNREGIPVIERFADWFEKRGPSAVSSFAREARQMASDLAPVGSSILQLGRTSLPIVIDALGAATPLIKGFADAFNSLPPDAQRLIVLGAGARYLTRNLSPLPGILPGVATGIGGIGTNAGQAGRAVGPAAGKFSALRSAIGTVGFYAAAAVTVGTLADASSQLQTALGKGPVLQGDKMADVLKGLTQSGFAEYADVSGINVNRLARELAKGGDTGTYTKQVLEDLTEATGGTNEGFAQLGGYKATLDRLTSPLKQIGIDLSTGGEEAWTARENLKNLVTELHRVKEAAKLDLAQQFDIAVALNPALAGLRGYREQLVKMPKQVLTQVLTPGALDSVKEVRALQKQYDLAPGKVETIMRALDFATPDIRRVMRLLDDVDKKRPKPTMDVENSRAVRKSLQTLDYFGQVDKAKPKGTLDADEGPAVRSSKEVLNWFGVVDKQHPTATIGARNEQALAATRAVLNALQAIVNHSWSVFIGVHGPGSSGGQPKNASGTRSFEGGVTWVGERGPELVVLPARTRIIDHQRSVQMASQAGSTGGAVDSDALASALARHLGPVLAASGGMQVVLPTGDPEAAAMSVLNALAAASAAV